MTGFGVSPIPLYKSPSPREWGGGGVGPLLTFPAAPTPNTNAKREWSVSVHKERPAVQNRQALKAQSNSLRVEQALAFNQAAYVEHSDQGEEREQHHHAGEVDHALLLRRD